MTKKLDTNRSYGVIIGNAGGAAYEQDGLLFGHDHLQVGGREQYMATPVAMVAPEQKEPEKTEEQAGEDSPDQDTALREDVLRMKKAGKAPQDIWRELGVHHTKVLAILKETE